MAQPDFPVSAEAHLLDQVVADVEGRATDWTTVAPRCYHQALLDTGLAALELPVREQGSDGTAAWTIRRMAYAIFINVPFAGLGGLLKAIDATSDRARPPATPRVLAVHHFHPSVLDSPTDSARQPVVVGRSLTSSGIVPEAHRESRDWCCRWGTASSTRLGGLVDVVLRIMHVDRHALRQGDMALARHHPHAEACRLLKQDVAPTCPQLAP